MDTQQVSWETCESCEVEEQARQYSCNFCHVKNKDACYTLWKNTEIDKKIVELFKLSGSYSLDTQYIYDELVKSGLVKKQ